jgi:hypothetical protein
VGFELTRPLFLGAGVLALLVIMAIWRIFPPPLPPRRARISFGLRALIVVLLTAALAGFQVQTTPSAQSLLVVTDLSASVQSALDSEAAAVRHIPRSKSTSARTPSLASSRASRTRITPTSRPRCSLAGRFCPTTAASTSC